MKTDLKKLDSYQAKQGEFSVLTVPEYQYLAVDGEGDPNTSKAFADAIETLYPLAYALKFMSKLKLDKDYSVPPLEGLWWANDMSVFAENPDKSQWKWTLLLMLPDWITADYVEQAKQTVRVKKPTVNVDLVHLTTFNEGLCVQTLYVGPYDQEGPIIKDMHHSFIPENNLELTGKHHEIYLSDMRRTAPEKLKTIIRQPVKQR